MIYARIDTEGAVLKYPYTLEQFQRDHPDEDIVDLADAIELGVVPVEDAPQPELAEGQTLDEGLPINSNGVYLRNWIVHDWLEIEPGGLYARIDGETVTYPYTAADVRRDFGVASRAGSIKQMDGEFGVVPVQAVEPPAVTAEQVAELDGIEEVEGVWQQKWTVRDRTADELEAAKAAMQAALRDLRWQHETGGTSVNGVPIRTDETSQGKIAAAVALMERDETLTAIDFEAQPGLWVSLDLAAITAVGLAAGRHVQECFSRAKVLSGQIDAAETFAALAAIDIEEGWPE